MTPQEIYISKYGNFTHILNICIDDELCENEKNTIIYAIYDAINNKQIFKNLLDNNIPITWRISNKTDLLCYYTNCGGILGDKLVQEHTKMLLNDIRQILNKDNFSLMVSKPLTKPICIL
jgi:hypothetical protein